jgi:hypothetical protein
VECFVIPLQVVKTIMKKVQRWKVKDYEQVPGAAQICGPGQIMDTICQVPMPPHCQIDGWQLRDFSAFKLPKCQPLKVRAAGTSAE